ncbi:protein bicaudal C homolog 1-A-like [Centruroides sculpturatus]|uniref:protein bicaudal C homolog 1-A-like n=1 Tax=Centruroides sculpturatus TaxID=218467 RepID=UPI000C6DFBE4|nr:protein bicaudal C homolog 1-A-like [Centruroides sculpturatus]
MENQCKVSESVVSENSDLSNQDVMEERFRVDRRKLEDMIQGEETDIEKTAAGVFFRKITEETGAEIYWPTRLKIGAKSKKDPNIKICGKPEVVLAAKERVLKILDTKRNKVTLKMDIPYTDHSHIIGKGGTTIQNIMEETECHIHFPDSNRTSTTEKSNQVSITGQTTGVEKARCKLRNLLPVVVTFELPAIYCQSPPEPSSPAIQLILQNYCFTATFHQQYKRILITARGLQKQFSRFRQGLHVLMEYLTGNDDFKLPVTLKTDVGLQNHQAVMGPASINVQQIKRNCNVNIVFQSTVTPITDTSQNRSAVYISGAFDDVYKAWKQLMGYLPLTLSFNLKEGQDIPSEQVTNMMSEYKVNIMMRLKKKENVKTITVQGPERESRILFEVRRQMLNLDKSEVPVCCDKHAAALASALFIATMSLTEGNDVCKSSKQVDERVKILNDFHSAMANIDKNFLPVQVTTNPKLSSIINNVLEQLNKTSNLEGPLPHFQNTYRIPAPRAEFCIPQTSCRPMPPQIKRKLDSESSNHLIKKPTVNTSSSSNFSVLQQNPKQNEFSGVCNPLFMPDIWSPQATSTTSWPCSQSTTSVQEKPTFSGWSFQQVPSQTGTHQLFSYNSKWGNDIIQTTQDKVTHEYKTTDPSSLYLSNKEKDTTIHNSSQSYHEVKHKMALSNVNGTENCMDMKDSSVQKNEKWNLKQLSNIDEYNSVSQHLNNFEENLMAQLSDLCYDEKWLLASKAFEQSVDTSTRKPTDIWSGCYFSKSLPDLQLKNKLKEVASSNLRNAEQMHTDLSDDKVFVSDSGGKFFSSSDYFDYSSQLNISWEDFNHLPRLFRKLGVEKYIDIFLENEIDLSVFLTLKDSDLQELGVTFVARRKMLHAISELNSYFGSMKKDVHFEAAPGSERKRLLSKLAKY